MPEEEIKELAKTVALRAVEYKLSGLILDREVLQQMLVEVNVTIKGVEAMFYSLKDEIKT